MGEMALLGFRRPVEAGGCCVEIESGGGPLGPREACTPAIWEKLLAGPEASTGGAGEG